MKKEVREFYVTIKVTVETIKEVDTGDIVDNLDYNISSTGKTKVIDTELLDFEPVSY